MGNENNGNPEGVSDLDTGPSLAELQAQLKATQEQLAAAAKEREMMLGALAEKDARRAPPQQRQEDPVDEEPLDPRTAKEIARLKEEHSASLNAVQDQFDEMSFLNYAASAGLDPALVSETAKTYNDYRERGVRVRGGDGRERPMTRADVLYQVIGKREVANAFKSAPEKNLAALKSRLVGPAGFEGGAMPSGERFVKIDSEIDSLPTKDKVSKLEKSLSNIEF